MKLEDTTPPEQPSMSGPRDAAKTTWQRPVLVRMGRLEDFVQAGGKHGTKFDMDPAGTRKVSLG